MSPPSPWVRRFAALIQSGGTVLDVAAGNGRHTALLLDMGFAVTAVDRNIAALQPLAGSRCKLHAIDLEAGPPAAALSALGDDYDGIIVTNYLHRPLFPWLTSALAPGGVLIYETFALGNERFGRPSNPDFLLRHGELIDAFAALTVIAFEQGEIGDPPRSVRQRIAAVNGPLGHLPPQPAEPQIAFPAKPA